MQGRMPQATLASIEEKENPFSSSVQQCATVLRTWQGAGRLVSAAHPIPVPARLLPASGQKGWEEDLPEPQALMKKEESESTWLFRFASKEFDPPQGLRRVEW